MTITPITSPTRQRLRAVRDRAPAPEKVAKASLASTRTRSEAAARSARFSRFGKPAYPPNPLYSWFWVIPGTDGLWTLVVRVRATGQQLRISYATATKPSEADGARVAARLMRFAKGAGR